MKYLEESSLVRDSAELWSHATQSQFLAGIAEGSLPEDAFSRWLAQDYHFAEGLLSFQAVLVAKSSRQAQKLLISGLSAVESELQWFEANAASRAIELESPVHPVCRRYVDFLVASAYTKPAEVLYAILFGVEAAYLKAWSALEARGPYAEFIERWSNDGFRSYVEELQELTEEFPHQDSQEHFNRVLELEREFWQMTLGEA